MNRKIIFRGKRKDNGEWAEGCFCYSEQEYTYYIGVTELLHPVEKETIGQFTGLKDKNGKRIFEKHIIKDLLYNVYYQCVFTRGKFCFQSEDGREFDFDSLYTTNGYDPHEIEIAGNIFDNKDLL